jgi:hypothetical protein
MGAERLFFYSAPDQACKLTDTFVIAGDTLIGYSARNSLRRAIAFDGAALLCAASNAPWADAPEVAITVCTKVRRCGRRGTRSRLCAARYGGGEQGTPSLEGVDAVEQESFILNY